MSINKDLVAASSTALVLAILCDFKGHDPQEVVNHSLTRLHA